MQVLILAIDPGETESAYVVMDENYKPIEFAKVANEELIKIINWHSRCMWCFTIEMVASYGMSVGKEVFETVFWIGRFWHEAEAMNYCNMKRIYRKDVKMDLCGQTKAKDSNIKQALIDRFGIVGTKKNPGWFYGFKADVWQAYALAVTYLDLLKEGEKA